MTPTSDKKLTTFMWIVGTILLVFCGAGLTVALSYGGTREKVEIHDQYILELKRTSVNYVYIEYLVESNHKLINILSTAPNTTEHSEALKAWKDFQDEILKRGNPVRGGKANTMVE